MNTLTPASGWVDMNLDVVIVNTSVEQESKMAVFSGGDFWTYEMN